MLRTLRITLEVEIEPPNAFDAMIEELTSALARKGIRFALRGTPAAPEPMASRLQFYSDDELAELGRQAGFSDVRIVRRDEEQFAREAGVPEEHVGLFRTGSPFLLARK